jgi:general secretion pathway protein L
MGERGLSAGDALLIFLGSSSGIEGWVQLRGAKVAARGKADDALPPLFAAETGEPLRTIAIAPGEQVLLHWLELPSGLAPAQAAAAARLMAADMSVQPVSEMHVAVGPEVEGENARAVALVPAITMAGWLSRLQAQGLDPDAMIPEPLLLPRPSEGFLRYDAGALALYRGRNDAFSIEPELAELIVAGSVVETIEAEALEDGLWQQISTPAVDLRQGMFAKRRRWKIEWPLVRRLAALGAAIMVVTLAIQIVAILRYTYAADALEIEANQLAAQTLRRSGPLSNAPAQLQQRLTELRGSGAGYGSLASALFDAVRATPNAELTAMLFDETGALRATVQGDTPATLSALQARLGSGGLRVEAGPLRTGGGRPAVELTVRTS